MKKNEKKDCALCGNKTSVRTLIREEHKELGWIEICQACAGYPLDEKEEKKDDPFRNGVTPL